MNADRRLPWDWYDGCIPTNVYVEDSAYIETSFSFQRFRSRLDSAVRYGRGASTYLGTMFDVGPYGCVLLGDYALVHGARIICDGEITIGDYALISWNVVLMDTYRIPFEPRARRAAIQDAANREPRVIFGEVPARPIRIERNVWIGFESCVLPGVTVGEGAVIGARSVVTEDVAPFTVVAGNPARPIRRLDRSESTCNEAIKPQTL
jgi:carbonic anhydrase/acetyltransferase-like protein (isoleucine patch superfamily)